MPRVKLVQLSPVEVRARQVRSSAAALGLYKDKDIAERLHISDTSLSNRFFGRAKWNLDDLEWLTREFHWDDAQIGAFVRGIACERAN